MKRANPDLINDEQDYVSAAGVIQELLRRHNPGSDRLVGVEVGTCRGVSAAAFCSTFNHLMLYTVDPYAPYDDWREHYGEDYQERVVEMAFNRLAPYIFEDRVMHMHTTSEKAAVEFEDESLDFVFIDGAHDYESVKKDLELWYPKVKVSGVFSGHDYGSIAGVTKAVDEFAQLKGLKVNHVSNNGWWMDRV